jgi:hypothetical protein
MGQCRSNATVLLPVDQQVTAQFGINYGNQVSTLYFYYNYWYSGTYRFAPYTLYELWIQFDGSVTSRFFSLLQTDYNTQTAYLCALNATTTPFTLQRSYNASTLPQPLSARYFLKIRGPYRNASACYQTVVSNCSSNPNQTLASHLFAFSNTTVFALSSVPVSNCGYGKQEEEKDSEEGREGRKS